jgi:hypothetical protein
MIISASYKTDIPAFYGNWFMNRLKAGYCKTVNPYGKQIYRINLSPDYIDGIIFWTKNILPFIESLKEIKERRYPFFISYTINNYPRMLEFSVIDAEKSIRCVKEIIDTYGSKSVVWRYDTILFSSLTPYEYHIQNFDWLASSLEGYVDEVVISFAQIYRKTLKNMNWAAKEFDFSWLDPDNSTKMRLATELAQIAHSKQIQLTMCSQPEYLAPGVKEAHCIDISRLSDIAGHSIYAKLKGNRKGCACYFSKDIGEYDTCPHGCVYCYAVQNRQLAQTRYKQHNPESEFLFEPEGYTQDKNQGKPLQEELF